MVAIAPTSSALPSLQTALGKVRLENARRDARQAQANANDLRTRADEAERQAQASQTRYQKISAQTLQDEPTYSRPRIGSSSEMPSKIQKLIARIYVATNAQRGADNNTLKESEKLAPIVSSQGQSTGRILDLSV
jgi:predicted nuclease with TOPRIM domain